MIVDFICMNYKKIEVITFHTVMNVNLKRIVQKIRNMGIIIRINTNNTNVMYFFFNLHFDESTKRDRH